jgi:hypothetical protein
MRRHELEAALRAAARVSREREFVIIGSQAVHASCRRAPAEVLLSQECDLYPRNHAEKAELLHFELGRGSKFARKHGFYVDVVTPEIATLPSGWERRLKVLRLGNVTAYCLEIHDLILSKLAAGRLKDLELAGVLFKLRIADAATVRRRIQRFPIPGERANLRSQLQTVLRNLD